MQLKLKNYLMCFTNVLSILKVKIPHPGYKNNQVTATSSSEPFRLRSACEESFIPNFDVTVKNMYGLVHSLNKYVFNSYDVSSVIPWTSVNAQRRCLLAHRQQMNTQTRNVRW